MSYILDALKKSESERQRQNAPGFADVPAQARPQKIPAWMCLLGALLLINAAVLGSILLRGNSADAPTSVPSTARVAETVVNSGLKPPAVSQAAPNATANAESAVTMPAPREPVAESVPAPVRQPVSSPPVVSRTAAPQPVRNSAPSAPAESGGLPTLMELRANGRLQLPDLHVDVHVYSSTPQDRFVFINMRKYREQARLQEGPLLTEIRQDGVVLEYQGSKFLLPRE